MISPSPIEVGLIVIVFILLFGPKKIPQVARSTGQAIGEFKKGRQELEQQIETDFQPEQNEQNDN